MCFSFNWMFFKPAPQRYSSKTLSCSHPEIHSYNSGKTQICRIIWEFNRIHQFHLFFWVMIFDVIGRIKNWFTLSDGGNLFLSYTKKCCMHVIAFLFKNNITTVWKKKSYGNAWYIQYTKINISTFYNSSRTAYYKNHFIIPIKIILISGLCII